MEYDRSRHSFPAAAVHKLIVPSYYRAPDSCFSHVALPATSKAAYPLGCTKKPGLLFFLPLILGLARLGGEKV